MDMTFEEWKEKYEPIMEFDKVRFFETYGADIALLSLLPREHIWTLVDGWEDDDGNAVNAIVSGALMVNRIVYIVTKNVWTEKYLTVSTPEE